MSPASRESGPESPAEADAGPRAVFLSYASQDAGEVRLLCAALRALGVEVWFDQNELRGGDEWDRCIRRQIRECALFVPVISGQTQARAEGYFRREWNLAVERLLDMAHGVPFLLPVALDETSERDALVPEEFLRVQWVRRPATGDWGEIARRIQALLGEAQRRRAGSAPSAPAGAGRRGPASRRRWGRSLAAVASAAVLGIVGWWLLGGRLQPDSRPGRKEPLGVQPDDLSIAVLAFANLSGDRENEYFSDGVSEELLNVLARIPGLRVAARTSSFHFKGRNPPVDEIRRVLGVNYVVEGSVRRQGGKVRIAAQLIKSADGFQAWAGAFERELKDIFALQDDIAQTIVGHVRGTLLGEAGERAARDQVQAASKGGTRSAEAYQRYLQGRFLLNRGATDDYRRAAEELRAAAEIDPHFALAWAQLGRVLAKQAQHALTPASFSDSFQQVRYAAEESLKLEPDLAEGHLVLAHVQLVWDRDVPRARRSRQRAIELGAGDAWVLATAAMMALFIGEPDEALRLGRLAVERDPVNPEVRVYLAVVHFYADQLDQAREEIQHALRLNPAVTLGPSVLAYICLQQGRPAEALAAAEREEQESLRLVPLALARRALGRNAEAEATVGVLVEKYGAGMAFNIAQIHALHGDADRAFAWLERALVQRDSGLVYAKADPFLRRLHADPRWPTFLRRLGFAESADSAGR